MHEAIEANISLWSFSMRHIPFRTILFSGLLVLGFFSCKPTGSSSSSDSEILAAESTEGASFALAEDSADAAPCPNPSAPSTETY